MGIDSPPDWKILDEEVRKLDYLRQVNANSATFNVYLNIVTTLLSALSVTTLIVRPSSSVMMTTKLLPLPIAAVVNWKEFQNCYSSAYHTYNSQYRLLVWISKIRDEELREKEWRKFQVLSSEVERSMSSPPNLAPIRFYTRVRMNLKKEDIDEY